MEESTGGARGALHFALCRLRSVFPTLYFALCTLRPARGDGGRDGNRRAAVRPRWMARTARAPGIGLALLDECFEFRFIEQAESCFLGDDSEIHAVAACCITLCAGKKGFGSHLEGFFLSHV